MQINVELTTEALSIPVLTESIQAKSETGAVVTFSGTVRGEENNHPISALDYTCYEPMAKKKMKEIAEEASKQWPLHCIHIVHRVGAVKVGEVSIYLCVESGHRKEAFEACAYLMDRLKEVVPIWKAIPKN